MNISMRMAFAIAARMHIGEVVSMAGAVSSKRAEALDSRCVPCSTARSKVKAMSLCSLMHLHVKLQGILIVQTFMLYTCPSLSQVERFSNTDIISMCELSDSVSRAFHFWFWCRAPPGAIRVMAMWDCIPGENAWRGAYTVSSILLEVQACILDKHMVKQIASVSR